MRRRGQTQVVVPADGWAEVPLNPQGEWMPTFAADLPPSATAVVDGELPAATAPVFEVDGLDWDLDAPPLFDDLPEPARPEISAPAPAPVAVTPAATIEQPVQRRSVADTAAIEREPSSSETRRPGRRVAVVGVCVVAAVAAAAATHHGAPQTPASAASPATMVGGSAVELTRAVSAAVDRGEVLARQGEQLHRRKVAAERRARARKAAAARRARERRKRARAAAAAARVVVRPQVRVAPPAPAAAARPAPAAPAHKSSGQSSGSAADQEFGL